MSSRRNGRLRREYLFKKSLEGKEKDLYERKEKLKEALATGKPIPGELKKEVASLKHAIELEDEHSVKPKVSQRGRRANQRVNGRSPQQPLFGPRSRTHPRSMPCSPLQTHIDDEYATAGIKDPKICLTTSRDPSSRLRQFTVEMKHVFPNSHRINRGNTTIKEIVDTARESDFSDLIVLQETRGEPDAMIVSHLPYGPTVFFSLSNTVLRHDIEDRGTVSEAYPHLIFHNFSTPLGARISTVLKYLFPVPKPDATRVLTFSNDSDYISFRHHTYEKAAGAAASAAAATGGAGTGAAAGGASGSGGLRKKDILLKEVGPRFELHPYQVRLGTVDQTESEVEWVLRPYMNTARKRKAL